MNPRSSLVYARPSFLRGIARIFDVTGSLNEYNTSPTSEQADYRALESDWRVVGEDIQEAMNAVKEDLLEQKVHVG